MVGFIGLSWFPNVSPWLWSALCGFGLGGAFPLCIVMALDHIDNPVQAGRLVSFMQGIGFMFASLMPLVTGWFRDFFGNYIRLATTYSRRCHYFSNDVAV